MRKRTKWVFFRLLSLKLKTKSTSLSCIFHSSHFICSFVDFSALEASEAWIRLAAQLFYNSNHEPEVKFNNIRCKKVWEPLWESSHHNFLFCYIPSDHPLHRQTRACESTCMNSPTATLSSRFVGKLGKDTERGCGWCYGESAGEERNSALFFLLFPLHSRLALFISQVPGYKHAER